MNISLFLYKGDVRCFFRRNLAKFIFAGIIVALAIIFAARNAFTLEDVNDYFESRSVPLFAFARGDGSLFVLFLISILEYALMLSFVLLCSYNDFLLFLSFAIVAYKAYMNVFNALVIFRYFVVRSLPFVILYLAFTAVLLCFLVGYIAFVMNSQCRYRYGIKEIKHLVCICVPLYIAFAVLLVLQILLICIGCAFI